MPVRLTVINVIERTAKHFLRPAATQNVNAVHIFIRVLLYHIFSLVKTFLLFLLTYNFAANRICKQFFYIGLLLTYVTFLKPHNSIKIQIL